MRATLICLPLLLTLAGCGGSDNDKRLAALEARVAKLESAAPAAAPMAAAPAAPMTAPAAAPMTASAAAPAAVSAATPAIAAGPYTLLITWADAPGTTTRSFPSQAACEAAKASLLDENRRTSAAIPAGTRLTAPPHLAKPTCMAG